GLFTSYEWQGGPLKGFGLGVGLFAIDDRGLDTFTPGGALTGFERVDLSVLQWIQAARDRAASAQCV
ncbi:MAG: hypothetical protein ACREYF_08550, partial [Gammaproteobacteria bacterium]